MLVTSTWREIATDLREQIESGALAPGARLPFEVELAERYGVQRNTVRLALAELVADGLVVRRRKGGTFVLNRNPVRVPFSVYQRAAEPGRDSRLGPWETACAALSIEGRTEVTGVAIVEAAPVLATRLNVERGAPLVRRTRHMWASGAIAQLQHAYYPLDLVEGTPLAEQSKVVGGAHAELARHDMTPAHCTIEAVARNATGAERDLLGLGVGAPILETWRTAFDQQDRRVELLHAVSAAHTAVLVLEQLPLRPEA